MNFDNTFLATVAMVSSLWLKILIIAALILYSLFALVSIKQVKLMSSVLDGSLNPILKVIAKINFIISVLVLVIAILVL